MTLLLVTVICQMARRACQFSWLLSERRVPDFFRAFQTFRESLLLFQLSCLVIRFYCFYMQGYVLSDVHPRGHLSG